MFYFLHFTALNLDLVSTPIQRCRNFIKLPEQPFDSRIKSMESSLPISGYVVQDLISQISYRPSS